MCGRQEPRKLPPVKIARRSRSARSTHKLPAPKLRQELAWICVPTAIATVLVLASDTLPIFVLPIPTGAILMLRAAVVGGAHLHTATAGATAMIVGGSVAWLLAPMCLAIVPSGPRELYYALVIWLSATLAPTAGVWFFVAGWHARRSKPQPTNHEPFTRSVVLKIVLTIAVVGALLRVFHAASKLMGPGPVYPADYLPPYWFSTAILTVGFPLLAVGAYRTHRALQTPAQCSALLWGLAYASVFPGTFAAIALTTGPVNVHDGLAIYAGPTYIACILGVLMVAVPTRRVHLRDAADLAASTD